MSNVLKNGNGDTTLKGGLNSGTSPHETLKDVAAKVAASKKPPKLKLPPSKRPDMSIFELLDICEQEASERDHEIAAAVGKWMSEESLPNLDKIEEKLKKHGARILTLIAGKDEDGNNITFEQQRDEYRKCNEEYLSAAIELGTSEDGEPLLLTADGKPFVQDAMETRRAAHMAVLQYRFRPEMDRGQLIDVVMDCLKEGYFIEDREGYIHVWQKCYMMSDDRKFGILGETEERFLAEIIGSHVSRINALYKDDVRQAAEELQKQSEISLKEFLELKEGKCLVHVPAGMDGSRRLSEVHLLMWGDGDGKAFIVDAAGSDKESALEIRAAKMHLLLPTLEIPYPPRVETLMNRGLSEENANKVRRLWHYVSRAKKAMEEKERREQEKEAATAASMAEEEARKKATEEAEVLKDGYAREATISLDRVLLEMEPMPGIFYGEFNGEWRKSNGVKIPKGLLYALFEQTVHDGKPALKVRKAPAHLMAGQFFTEANMEFADYNAETFEGLEKPLYGLMKALLNQTKKLVNAEAVVS